MIEKSLSLVANSLLFLSQEKADVSARFPEGAPERLVTLTKHVAQPKVVRRATSKLASLGYHKVKFVGDAIEKEVGEARPGVNSTMPTGAAVTGAISASGSTWRTAATFGSAR